MGTSFVLKAAIFGVTGRSLRSSSIFVGVVVPLRICVKYAARKCACERCERSASRLLCPCRPKGGRGCPFWGSVLLNRFQSLRVRLLFPLLAVAFVASVGVAAASYWLGDRWEREQVARRYQEVESTLGTASFPLTALVVKSIANLTETDLITLDANEIVIQSSLPLQSGVSVDNLTLKRQQKFADDVLTIASENYRYSTFVLRTQSQDSSQWVAVLFNESELREARWRMVSFPLLTGFSTIILLTSVTLLFASRLVRRLSTLQQCVGRISTGEFTANVPTGANDEVGRLGVAVTRMSRQLLKMQETLQRQQGEKLLHQVAGGLAHQLRNSITGARMAIELHQQRCELSDDSLGVALHQLEHTEAHVRRLLTVAAGREEQDSPERALLCLEDSMRTLMATANHLRIDLDATLAPELADVFVSDGPSLQAAFSNLVLNAMYEGTRVTVKCVFLTASSHEHESNTAIPPGSDLAGVADRQQERVSTHTDCGAMMPGRTGFALLTVRDDGDGPPADVADEIFEPFVTSKPEGLGLGLPLVARCARRLGGKVHWDRVAQQTTFSLRFKVTEAADQAELSESMRK